MKYIHSIWIDENCSFFDGFVSPGDLAIDVVDLLGCIHNTLNTDVYAKITWNKVEDLITFCNRESSFTGRAKMLGVYNGQVVELPKYHSKYDFYIRPSKKPDYFLQTIPRRYMCFTKPIWFVYESKPTSKDIVYSFRLDEDSEYVLDIATGLEDCGDYWKFSGWFGILVNPTKFAGKMLRFKFEIESGGFYLWLAYYGTPIWFEIRGDIINKMGYDYKDEYVLEVYIPEKYKIFNYAWDSYTCYEWFLYGLDIEVDGNGKFYKEVEVVDEWG